MSVGGERTGGGVIRLVSQAGQICRENTERREGREMLVSEASTVKLGDYVWAEG